jgi:hypothetical protein
VDESAEDAVTLDALRRERDDVRVVGRGSQLQGPVQPSGVVVLGVLGEDPVGF